MLHFAPKPALLFHKTDQGEAVTQLEQFAMSIHQSDSILQRDNTWASKSQVLQPELLILQIK